MKHTRRAKDLKQYAWCNDYSFLRCVMGFSGLILRAFKRGTIATAFVGVLPVPEWRIVSNLDAFFVAGVYRTCDQAKTRNTVTLVCAACSKAIPRPKRHKQQHRNS